MILGMSTATFTLLHVVISLVGIATGIVVVLGLISGKRLDGWTGLFITTTVATSVTGFMFHSASFGPPHVIGVISLVILAFTIFAMYVRHLLGAWRWIYIVSAILALYLNVFVGVIQSFQKISFLQPLAPTQSEPPFVLAQVIVIVLFIVAGILAVKRFHPRMRGPTFA